MRRVIRGFRPDVLAAGREAAGLSRGELARLAETTDVTIARWEKGQVAPQIDKLARVVALLNLSMSDVINVPPGERFLSYWRYQRGWTQNQLAFEAGLSKTLVEQVERGERIPDEKIENRLRRVLGITVEEFRAAHTRVRGREGGTPA